MKILQRFMLVYFSFVLIITAIQYTAYQKVGQIQTSSIKREKIKMNAEVKETVVKKKGYKTIALFGTDTRDHNLGKGTRTDCIIIAKLNQETGKIKLLSVYRDTLLDIGGSYSKCNAAYAFGGPEQAISMLNTNLDMDITDYITVDWSAVSNTIDLMGGIEIEIQEEELSDLNKYIGETAKEAGKQPTKVKKAGLQLLDGVQATTYARIRHTEGGDFKRAERQRDVLYQMLEKAKTMDLPTLYRVINDVFPKIRTSLQTQEILDYAKNYASYEIEGMEGFPFDKTTATLDGYGSIVIPQSLKSNVEKLHDYFGNKDYQVSEEVKDKSERIHAITGK